MNESPPIEEFEQLCLYCKKSIKLQWANGLLPGDYVLIADWVYHPECWNNFLKEDPLNE